MAFIHGLNRVRPGRLSLVGGLGGSGFWSFFPASFWCTNLYIIYPFLVDFGPPLVGQVGAHFCTRPISCPSLLSVSCDDRSHPVQASFLINMVRTLVGAFNAEGMYLL